MSEGFDERRVRDRTEPRPGGRDGADEKTLAEKTLAEKTLVVEGTLVGW